MAKVAGVDVLLYVGTQLVGGQSGATLNRSTNIIDATSKDSNGWAENMAGIKSWSIDCDGYLVVDDVAQEALEQAWLNQTELDAEIRMPNGKKYTGKCLIADFPVSLPKDDAVTFTLSLTGTGALTVTSAPVV